MTTTKCAKCGGIVRLDRAACPACGAVQTPGAPGAAAPAPAAAPPAPARRREDVETEIRSRVMWGEAPQEIRSELVRQGVRPGDVDGMVRRAVEERKKHYKSLGVRNVAAGAGLLGLGIIIFIIVAAFMEGHVRRMPVYFLAAAIGLPIAGILLLVKGIGRISRQGEGEREASEVEEG